MDKSLGSETFFGLKRDEQIPMKVHREGSPWRFIVINALFNKVRRCLSLNGRKKDGKFGRVIATWNHLEYLRSTCSSCNTLAVLLCRQRSLHEPPFSSNVSQPPIQSLQCNRFSTTDSVPPIRYPIQLSDGILAMGCRLLTNRFEYGHSDTRLPWHPWDFDSKWHPRRIHECTMRNAKNTRRNAENTKRNAKNMKKKANQTCLTLY